MFIRLRSSNLNIVRIHHFSRMTHHHDRFFEVGTGRYSIMGQSRKTGYLVPKRPSRLRRHGDLWGRMRPQAVEDDTRPLVEG
jgi:hypothetical protein